MGSRPRAFQQAVDGVRVAQKVIIFCFVFFLYKIQLQSNRVCYKVSLYENFQWQSCSITIPPVHRYWREALTLQAKIQPQIDPPS